MRAQQKQVTGFFILVFALSAPVWVLGNVYEVELLPGLPIGSLIAFAPGIAAMLMTYRYRQPAAVVDLLKRSFDFDRVKNKKWYHVFALFNPVVAIAAYGVMCALGTEVPTLPFFTLAAVPLFIAFFVAALGEEIGWTGYATEPLLRRLGILKTGVFLGLVWVAFHLIVLLQANRSFSWIAWWALGTISLRTLMVWLYSRGGDSVFAAALFHAMINLSWQLFPVYGSFYDPRIFSLITLALAILLVSVRWLVVRNGMAAA